MNHKNYKNKHREKIRFLLPDLYEEEIDYFAKTIANLNIEEDWSRVYATCQAYAALCNSFLTDAEIRFIWKICNS